MSRALLALLALSLAAGCTRRCKEGSVLLSLSSPVTPADGDRLSIHVVANGQADAAQTLTLAHPGASGSVEIDFGSAYPRGTTITIEVDQQRNGATIASNRATLMLQAACEAVPFVLQAAAGDLGPAPGDLAEAVDLATPIDLAEPPADLVGPGCPVCTPAEASSGFCISGTIYDFATNTTFGNAATFTVAAYDSPAVQSGTSLAKVDVTRGCYLLANVPPPPSGLLALVVQDPPGTATPTLAMTESLLSVQTGGTVVVDAYRLPKSVVDGWTSVVGPTGDGGIYDYYGQGGVIVQLFGVAYPGTAFSLANANNNLVSGATVTAGGGAIGFEHFLGPDRAQVVDSLTSTSSSGRALLRSFTQATSIGASGGNCGGSSCTFQNGSAQGGPHLFQIINLYL